ncbi:hypothetical protein M885DRAFT_612821 [Pelagophyceae sp. CCMP2097]|nr:hypothetical protein M885DRAFT_612821 [Pelagophyceae sp. CCMP2097]|mmetsp:Transcript_26304/g.90417  ORF Transcript_26304/g.90417 Transcript_26304/m.90417 type:complete len:279 (+) Transcript_26304:30-866(+)
MAAARAAFEDFYELWVAWRESHALRVSRLGAVVSALRVQSSHEQRDDSDSDAAGAVQGASPSIDVVRGLPRGFANARPESQPRLAFDDAVVEARCLLDAGDETEREMEACLHRCRAEIRTNDDDQVGLSPEDRLRARAGRGDGGCEVSAVDFAQFLALMIDMVSRDHAAHASLCGELARCARALPRGVQRFEARLAALDLQPAVDGAAVAEIARIVATADAIRALARQDAAREKKAAAGRRKKKNRKQAAQDEQSPQDGTAGGLPDLDALTLDDGPNS